MVVPYSLAGCSVQTLRMIAVVFMMQTGAHFSVCWRMGGRWMGSLLPPTLAGSCIQNIIFLAFAGALALTGVIVKGVVFSAPRAMWANVLTVASVFVEPFSVSAGSLLTLALALILIPQVPTLAPLVVAALTITSVSVHDLWTDTRRCWAHTFASVWVNNL